MGGELVLVKTKPSAKGSGSATLKPKDEKLGDDGASGKDGDGGKGGDASGKGKDAGGDDASDKEKSPDGGRGDATVMPEA